MVIMSADGFGGGGLCWRGSASSDSGPAQVLPSPTCGACVASLPYPLKRRAARFSTTLCFISRVKQQNSAGVGWLRERISAQLMLQSLGKAAPGAIPASDGFRSAKSSPARPRTEPMSRSTSSFEQACCAIRSNGSKCAHRTSGASERSCCAFGVPRTSASMTYELHQSFFFGGCLIGKTVFHLPTFQMMDPSSDTEQTSLSRTHRTPITRHSFAGIRTSKDRELGC